VCWQIVTVLLDVEFPALVTKKATSRLCSPFSGMMQGDFQYVSCNMQPFLNQGQTFAVLENSCSFYCTFLLVHTNCKFVSFTTQMLLVVLVVEC
jgi:hypothetical protein